MSSDGVVFVDAKLGCSILARLQRSIRAAQAVDLSPSQTHGQGKCLTLYYQMCIRDRPCGGKAGCELPARCH